MTTPTREIPVAPAVRGSPARTWGLTALAALAPVTWGTTYIVTTEYLPPDRPLLSGAIRALPAGLVLLAITRALPHGAWWWRSAVLGTLNIGAFFALLFIAAYRLPGGVAATLAAVQPLLVAGLAFALLGEHPTRWRLGWAIAGVVGVAMMVLRGRLAFDLAGVLAGLAGTMAMATGIVLMKRWGRPGGVLAFTGWQLTAGGVLLTPLALLVEGPPPALDASALAGYAWLAVPGTLVAYALWFQGLERLPVAALSFLPLLSPAVATALGWLVLGQSLSLVQTLGFGLALASIAAAQLTPDTARNLVHQRRRRSQERHGTSSTDRSDQGATTVRITVFGANGSVGSRVVTEALSRGHDVTAVVRDPARSHALPAGANARAGDVGNVGDVIELSTDQDVVISATRPPPGDEVELVETTEALLAGLARTGVRLLLVGGAGGLTVPGTGGTTVIDHPNYMAAAYRDIALANIGQLEACRAEPGVDWAYLSPAALMQPGERTGHYRLGTDELLVDAAGNSRISTEDLAVALLDEAERPKHHQTRFTVAN